ELLAGYAGRILDLWREAGEEMATHRGVFSGTLRVGAITTAEYLLPPLLVDFVDQYPKVKVKLQVGNRDQIVRLLAGQEIDLAIMGRPPSELKTEASAIAKHPMAFVAAPGHPLMHDPGLSLATLAEARILVRERGSGTRTTVERLFKDAGLTLRIGSELSSNEAIKQMCAAGFGVAFLSMHTCVLEMQAGLLAPMPLPGNPVQRDWYVMHLASRQLPHVAQAFEEFLRGQAQQRALMQLGALPRSEATTRKPRASVKKTAAKTAMAAAQKPDSKTITKRPLKPPPRTEDKGAR
ncbi:MAG: LysR substrate-binding domain-containing protein, partial [Rhizobacter sp.]|nr:LysR substrate-binding domain-containing protein [Rhizobacter sp.]